MSRDGRIPIPGTGDETDVRRCRVDGSGRGTSPSLQRGGSRTSRRAPQWADVPDALWNDWRWQLSHRLNSLEELSQIIHLTPEEKEGIRSHHFRVDVTPYFASLIDPEDPNCPIRRQVIPTSQELGAFDGMVVDSLNEDGHSPVPGLVHRYPDRVLMMVTTQCASYCRYCTRSRLVGDPAAQFSRSDYDRQIEYIAQHPQVRDVLLSGGDPLLLPVKVLEDLLTPPACDRARRDHPPGQPGSGLPAAAHHARTGGNAAPVPSALGQHPFQPCHGD